jgi:lysophospholipase L1-like esterase
MAKNRIGYVCIVAVAMAVGGVLGAALYRNRLQSIPYFGSHQSLYGLSKAQRPIVMLGDSLTAGVPWNEITACPNVVTRAVWGDTSADILNRLDDVMALEPSAVFLMIGTNDIVRGVKGSDVVENTKRIVDKLSGVDVFAHYVLPVGERIERSKAINEEMSTLNAALGIDLKPRLGARLIDMRREFTDAAGYLQPALTIDGVHFTAAAYAIWRDRIEASILEHCRATNRRQ